MSPSPCRNREQARDCVLKIRCRICRSLISYHNNSWTSAATHIRSHNIATIGRAFTKHPDALLHPQSPVVTLLWRRCNFFGDGSSTCGLPYRDDTTTGSDRITKQAGRNHRIRTHSNTHAHTTPFSARRSILSLGSWPTFWLIALSLLHCFE